MILWWSAMHVGLSTLSPEKWSCDDNLPVQLNTWLHPYTIGFVVLQVLLKDVDSILYVDTDILFLRPLDDVWDHFHKFNSSQFAALAPEHEDEQTSWYKRFARHPYYGHLGLLGLQFVMAYFANIFLNFYEQAMQICRTEDKLSVCCITKYSL